MLIPGSKSLTNVCYDPGATGRRSAYLEMLCAELATEELVLLPHVVLQLFKLGEDLRLWTARTLW